MQRISADLHDGPAQLLTYALLRLERLARIIEVTGDTCDGKELTYMRSALNDTLTELRNISQGLSLPKLSSVSLEETIRLAISLHQEQTGSRVELTTRQLPADAPQPLKACVYRVLQVSLSNAYKHALAKDQKVVAYVDKQFVLEVSDKGPGFDPSEDYDGLGLTGMRARVESQGGVLTITSRKDQGTILTALLEIADTPA